ncbi:hypothetical protein HALLA_21225 (plasmid) [Halostagnicola larsenii XH-48]|uniref:Uncharacterized protein n=1 Tax=Halostagnicola larsenii XH-48 TaxID=797299 RepID=W0JZ04_9EURY|nr:hypothetical protein [Halostagnicola larsenii]AHG02430.1 hypothetical protein HALLA_21225 [Halostagnicola larsenii XH-48]
MPDDNRFAGLGSAVEDEEPEPESVEETTSESDTDELEREESVSDSEPAAFPFDDTTKKTVYVRPETIDDLEDARALVDAQLRTEHDVRNLTGREFYDAAFRLAADDTDGLIDELLAARGESDDE